MKCATQIVLFICRYWCSLPSSMRFLLYIIIPAICCCAHTNTHTYNAVHGFVRKFSAVHRCCGCLWLAGNNGAQYSCKRKIARKLRSKFYSKPKTKIMRSQKKTNLIRLWKCLVCAIARGAHKPKHEIDLKLSQSRTTLIVRFNINGNLYEFISELRPKNWTEKKIFARC